MWKYAATISYLGTNYCGWQKQRGSAALGDASVQETVEKVLSKIIQEAPSVVASGRTDAGVHALAQVAHFVIKNKKWECDVLMKGMNALLPKEIQIVDLKEAKIEFHAQRSAIKKQYSYYIQQGPTQLPHCYPVSWWIRKKLDIDKMKTAITHLNGEHDFKAFQASGANPGSTVREIFETEISFEQVHNASSIRVTDKNSMFYIRVRVVGSGFLKQMVRSIAGTLVEVGENKLDTGVFKVLLDTKDRSLLGKTAPGRGLWLERVWYP